MKISEKLEIEYAEKKSGDQGVAFFTKGTIRDVVAAELFIPIVEELYDKNIFTSWSGLEKDAHIRIPLDGLSKENFMIAKRNCETSKNWRLQRPPYLQSGQKDIPCNYSFEIYINYEEGITDVSEVVEKMFIEIRKLRYQDVQIAKAEYAKQSQLPRLDLNGLYKISEEEVFNIDTQTYEMVPAESMEELSEMFLNGDNPEYVYDKQSDTYFRNKELIEKSRKYNEYDKDSQKREERAIEEIGKIITEDMTEEQKYKVIFDWVVHNFDYAYSGLNYAYAEQVCWQERDKHYIKYYVMKCRQHGIHPTWLGIESRRNFLEMAKTDLTIPEEAIKYSERIVDFLEKYEKCRTQENGFDPNDIKSSWLSRFGVCLNFASIYEFLCNKFNLHCKFIQGTIDSGDYNVNHAWNAIMVNGKLKYVDISSAIHCKDGQDTKNQIDDFFNKSLEGLRNVDGGRNREIAEHSQGQIRALINESEGWNVDD